MEIEIREFTVGDETVCAVIDDSFTVDSTLILSLTDGEIGYTIKEIPGYIKSYSEQPFKEAGDRDFSACIGNPEQIVYVAWAENQAVGRIVLKRNWNRYALVEDLAVDKSFRGRGVGRKLIEQAKRWAKNAGMPGIMLETQSNNVKACLFYENCGFIIGGFDYHLYRGIHHSSDEAAIFWYHLLE